MPYDEDNLNDLFPSHGLNEPDLYSPRQRVLGWICVAFVAAIWFAVMSWGWM